MFSASCWNSFKLGAICSAKEEARSKNVLEEYMHS